MCFAWEPKFCSERREKISYYQRLWGRSEHLLDAHEDIEFICFFFQFLRRAKYGSLLIICTAIYVSMVSISRAMHGTIGTLQRISPPTPIKTHFIYAQLDWFCISQKWVLSHSYWLTLFHFGFLLVDVISINFVQTLLTIPPYCNRGEIVNMIQTVQATQNTIVYQ